MIRLIHNLFVSYWNTRARIQFALRGVKWPSGLTVKGKLGLASPGTIELGRNITIANESKYNRAGVNHPTQLIARPGATLKIGNNVGISGGSIFCANSISIGDYVLVGANSKIYDTDFHALDYMDRRQSKPPKTAPVVIEDDVWLCANVTVLKGVTIGARSIVAAGSVVTRDIPADTIAAGIPAKPISTLKAAGSQNSSSFQSES